MTTTRSVIFACTLLGLASTVNASPFSITLVGSGSESGGSGETGSGGGGGSHRSGVASTSDSAALAGLGLAMGAPVTASGNAVRPNVASIIGAAKLVAAIGEEPLAQLDLGNGESLAVSGAVGDSLAAIFSDSAPDVASPSTAQTHSVANAVSDSTSNNALNPLGEPTTVPAGGGAQSDILNSVITDIAGGIVSPPAATTNPLTADVGGGVGGAQEPAHAPEPATLLLFASALAFAGRRLRRRRYQR